MQLLFDFVNLIDSSTDWMIDSGTSFHITYKRDLFISYTPGDFDNVKTTNEGVQNTVVLEHKLTFRNRLHKVNLYSEID